MGRMKAILTNYRRVLDAFFTSWSHIRKRKLLRILTARWIFLKRVHWLSCYFMFKKWAHLRLVQWKVLLNLVGLSFDKFSGIFLRYRQNYWLFLRKTLTSIHSFADSGIFARGICGVLGKNAAFLKKQCSRFSNENNRRKNSVQLQIVSFKIETLSLSTWKCLSFPSEGNWCF